MKTELANLERQIAIKIQEKQLLEQHGTEVQVEGSKEAAVIVLRPEGTVVEKAAVLEIAADAGESLQPARRKGMRM